MTLTRIERERVEVQSNPAESGYCSSHYARAFAEWGQADELVHAGGWVIEREIPRTGFRDAMGCYPLFACNDWKQLGEDLGLLGKSMVSLTLVTDPFGNWTEPELGVLFPDLCRPYKNHFTVELNRPPETFVHPHHLRNARKALQAAAVRYSPGTLRLLDEWVRLYGTLIARHNITGIAAFSPASFGSQFQVPGLVVQWAEAENEVVGMVLWYVMGERAYYHLGAYTETGYALKCSFALFLDAIETFANNGVRWLNLGAGAGAVGGEADGLTRFKSGWANGTRPVYLCGRIFDPERYHALSASSGQSPSTYFPAYRQGEFR